MVNGMSLSSATDSSLSTSGSLTNDFSSTHSQGAGSLFSNSTSDLNTESLTSADELAKQPTTGEQLASYPTTLELSIGMPVGEKQLRAESTQLAQNGLFPNYVEQELKQQLQPVKGTLDELLTSQPGQPALDIIAQHRDTIIAAAEKAGVDPQQVASIIKKNFMVVGLMQKMP
jgi:hypothetical protein